MQFILLLSFLFHNLTSPPLWLHDLNDAKQQAVKEHKLILLNFSGSDWCGPCIRLHLEVFTQPDFIKMAETDLILVNADFPRNKKNQLPPVQQKINETIADTYNTKGSFPLTVLLDADGKNLKSWEGFPKTSVADFIKDIQQTIDKYKK